MALPVANTMCQKSTIFSSSCLGLLDHLVHHVATSLGRRLRVFDVGEIPEQQFHVRSGYAPGVGVDEVFYNLFISPGG